MIKTIFAALVLCLATTNAFASGKLTVGPVWSSVKEQPTMSAGLSIYEFVFRKNTAINSWTGFGEQEFPMYPEKPNVKWYTTKNSLDFHIADVFIVSAGFTVRYVMPYKQFNNDLFAKASVKLW